MHAGKLIEKVSFREPVTSSDGQGGQEDGWSARFTTFAGYTRLRGSESVLAARLEGRQPTVIRVRAFGDTKSVNTDWKIVDLRTDEEFNIRSMIETEDRRFIDFTCESGAAV